MLGSPILYLKGMRAIMFQLSGFYCNNKETLALPGLWSLRAWRAAPGACPVPRCKPPVKLLFQAFGFRSLSGL